MSDALPNWETGPSGLLAFLGVLTPCCVGCAADFVDGYEHAGVSFEFKQGEEWREVLCCCAHKKPLESALHERGVKTR